MKKKLAFLISLLLITTSVSAAGKETSKMAVYSNKEIGVQFRYKQSDAFDISKIKIYSGKCSDLEECSTEMKLPTKDVTFIKDNNNGFETYTFLFIHKINKAAFETINKEQCITLGSDFSVFCKKYKSGNPKSSSLKKSKDGNFYYHFSNNYGAKGQYGEKIYPDDGVKFNEMRFLRGL